MYLARAHAYVHTHSILNVYLCTHNMQQHCVVLQLFHSIYVEYIVCAHVPHACIRSAVVLTCIVQTRG